MRRCRLVVLAKKNIFSFLSAVIISFVIFHINLFFFSELDLEDIVSTNIIDSMSSSPSTTENSHGKLAIIIDDFGQNRNGVEEMTSINRHLTFAVMPFLTFSQSDAENSHNKGFEIIVHLPMEAYTKLGWVGPRPILSVMSSSEVQQVVYDSFENIPYAVGANIHMGSKAGDDRRVISDILDVIKEKGVYFVDSRASRNPVAKKIGDEKSIKCFDRNVFIDGKKPKSYIKKQLLKAGEMALKNGQAIAIGHVGTEGGKVTAQAINEMLPEFDKRNVQLVFVSELE